MKSPLRTFTTLILFLLISSEGYSQSESGVLKQIDSQKSIQVGFLKLITNPEKYNGKMILTKAYLDPGGLTLYFHEEDHKYQLRENGISVELSDATRLKAHTEKTFGHYVLIKGRFYQNVEGSANSLGLNGKLTDVKHLEVIRDYSLLDK